MKAGPAAPVPRQGRAVRDPAGGSAFRGARPDPGASGGPRPDAAAPGARGARARRGRRDLSGGDRDDARRTTCRWRARPGTVRLSLASGVPDRPAGELGLAGRLAEVGPGEPEVRPAGLGRGRARRSTSSARRGEADDRDAVQRDDGRPDGRAHRRWSRTCATAIRSAGPTRGRLASRMGDGSGASRPGGARRRMPPVDQETPSVPIFQTSTFRFESSEDYAETIAFRAHGYTYSRGYGNPRCRRSSRRWPPSRAPRRRSGSHRAWRRSTPSSRRTRGAGDRVVVSNELYGGTYSLATKLLPRFGVEVTMVDPHDLEAVRDGAARRGALLRRDDREPERDGGRSAALGALCREAGVPASVDNTFASPYLCTPAALGFDFVLHSATKYIGGHHDLIGGVVCTTEAGRARLRDTAIDTGGTMAPFEAWLCLRGLMTLAAADGSAHRERDGARRRSSRRTRRSSASGTRGWPPIRSTRSRRAQLPRGAGRDAGGRGRRRRRGRARFCDALELAWVATSLGGTHTLVGHAASTTHRQMDARGPARRRYRRRPRARERRHRGRRRPRRPTSRGPWRSV